MIRSGEGTIKFGHHNKPRLRIRSNWEPVPTGFGDYTETGQVIPVTFRGREGGYWHCMFLNDDPPAPPIASCGISPRNSPIPRSIRYQHTRGLLDYGPVRVATGSMDYKHKQTDVAAVAWALAAPNFLLKIIAHGDSAPRIRELVDYYLEDITVKGAWKLCIRPPMTARCPNTINGSWQEASERFSLRQQRIRTNRRAGSGPKGER